MQNDMKDMSRNIKKVAFFFLGLISVLFIYVSYVQIWEGNFLLNHPLNRRTLALTQKIPLGDIVDRNGEKLAYSKFADGEYKREYPYGKIMAHVVGYSSSKYGKTGIEGTYGSYLSGINNPLKYFGPVVNLIPLKSGNIVVLSIDSSLQKVAYQALGNHRGAVVAMNPKTGEILAMVSKPGFEPSNIDETWDSVSKSKESVLLNRGLQGLYPPGSILKVMIAEAALSEKVVDFKRVFNCEGALPIDSDYTLKENNMVAHGKVDLSAALAESCNVTFGTIALELGTRKMEDTFKRYAFNQSVEELDETNSRLPDFASLGKGELAQTGIGQGSLLVTPLKMAMLASCFANNGVVMKPYLVEKVLSHDGAVIKSFSPNKWLTPVEEKYVKLIVPMMVRTVKEGTGTGANISGVSVAGKTGTAENPHGEPHAWFLGFAPAENPQIALAVIVENGGAGGSVAAPIAKALFQEVLY